MPFNDTILEEITTVEVYKKREHCQNCACTRTPTSGSEVRLKVSACCITKCVSRWAPGCPRQPARPAAGGPAGQASPGSRGRSPCPRDWRTNSPPAPPAPPCGRCRQAGRGQSSPPWSPWCPPGPSPEWGTQSSCLMPSLTKRSELAASQ